MLLPKERPLHCRYQLTELHKGFRLRAGSAYNRALDSRSVPEQIVAQNKGTHAVSQNHIGDSRIFLLGYLFQAMHVPDYHGSRVLLTKISVSAFFPYAFSMS